MLLVSATLIVWGLCAWSLLSAVRVRGLLGKIRRLVAAAVWAGLGLLLSFLLVVLHAFQAFAGQTLVARVTTRQVGSEAFELTYTPATGGRALIVPLQGDQWSISGGIVKWHPWLTALGVKSYHQPRYLSGQFSSLDKQRSHLPTVYPLEPLADRVWEALYWADPYLPFIEAVYGSSAYVYVEPPRVQEVYVTPSGYLITRHPGDEKSG